MLGKNNAGQCNPPADLENVVQVCCGTSHTAALTADGQVVCWGDNNYYQCDVPERFAQKNPGVVHVAGSYNTVSIITSDGCVVCWGNNDAGQCNPPADLTNVVSIYVGYHIAAVTTDGRVVCWGDNEYGQCNVPSDLLPVVSVHCSDYRTYAITSDGMVTYWGFGQSSLRSYSDKQLLSSGLSPAGRGSLALAHKESINHYNCLLGCSVLAQKINRQQFGVT